MTHLKFTAVDPVTAKIALPQQALQAHNRYRALHHSPSLNWSETLATEAQAIAQRLATQDLHSGRRDSAMDLGQNLAKLAGMKTNKELTSLNGLIDVRRLVQLAVTLVSSLLAGITCYTIQNSRKIQYCSHFRAALENFMYLFLMLGG